MIQHTVAFRLKHPVGSAEEADFLAAAATVGALPGVRDYQQLRQVSPKCDHDYWFTMFFDDQAAYDAYNAHPEHVAFVRDRWQAEVVDFQEMDFVALDAPR